MSGTVADAGGMSGTVADVATSAPGGGPRRTRRAGRGVALRWLALLSSLLATPAGAVEFERLEATEEAGTFRVDASLLVEAPFDVVLAVLRDYEGQVRIAPFIREVKVVGQTPEGSALVRLVTELCIGPFCTDVRQFQLLRFVPPGRISGIALRAGSDVASGRTEVEVSAAGARTRVRIDAVARPARRLPSFLPTRWVLGALRRQARESGEGLEALAVKLAKAAHHDDPDTPRERVSPSVQ